MYFLHHRLAPPLRKCAHCREHRLVRVRRRRGHHEAFFLIFRGISSEDRAENQRSRTAGKGLKVAPQPLHTALVRLHSLEPWCAQAQGRWSMPIDLIDPEQICGIMISTRGHLQVRFEAAAAAREGGNFVPLTAAKGSVTIGSDRSAPSPLVADNQIHASGACTVLWTAVTGRSVPYHR